MVVDKPKLTPRRQGRQSFCSTMRMCGTNPARRLAAWACSLVSRAAYATAAAFCFTRRSDFSMPIRSTFAFLRQQRRRVSVSTDVKDRQMRREGDRWGGGGLERGSARPTIGPAEGLHGPLPCVTIDPRLQLRQPWQQALQCEHEHPAPLGRSNA